MVCNKWMDRQKDEKSDIEIWVPHLKADRDKL